MRQSASTDPSDRAASGHAGQAEAGWGSLPRVFGGRVPIIAAAFAAVLALSACASSEYIGISLKPGLADVELQELARRAQAGDRHAQLELGTRYEEGRGVPVNYKRSRSLYTAAAADTGGTSLIHVPSSQKGGGVQSIPVNTGPRVEGLLEAKQKLLRLEILEFQNSARAKYIRSAYGTVKEIGSSKICETDLPAVQAIIKYSVNECFGNELVLTKNGGSTVVLVDLMLITHDLDAIADVPIPFGLMDPLEQILMFVGDQSSVKGEARYIQVPVTSGTANIIISFAEKG